MRTNFDWWFASCHGYNKVHDQVEAWSGAVSKLLQQARETDQTGTWKRRRELQCAMQVTVNPQQVSQ